MSVNGNCCFLCFSKTDGTCYGQDADKNRMARYIYNLFLVAYLQV